MSARGLDGILDAICPGSSQTDDICIDTRLRNQVLPRCVNVAGPLLAYMGPLFGRELVVGRAAAFAKPPHIEGKRVDSSRRQLRGHIVPRLTCPVGLMEQQ